MNTDGISVIVSTYDDPITLVSQCLNSLLFQEKIHEIVIVDSSKKDDIKKLCYSFDNDKINYVYSPPKGLSEARNIGMKIAKKQIMAFTDADCIADKTWAEHIYNSFSDIENDKVAIVGGKVLPNWLLSNPNKILSRSSISQGFYSLFNMGGQLKEVEIIFGGNFAINKILINDCIFRNNLRTKENLIGGEETDLCRRVKKNKLKVIYNPSVVVWHQIPRERISFRWMWKRMYFGGASKILLGSKITPKVVKEPYNFYDIIFLAIFIVPYLYGMFSTKIKQMF